MNQTNAFPRILSVLAALCLFLTSLTACSGGVTREETRTAMDSLLSALDNENYAEAAALYHPDAAMSEDLLAVTKRYGRANWDALNAKNEKSLLFFRICAIITVLAPGGQSRAT